MLDTGPPKIEELSNLVPYDLVNLAVERISSEQDPSQASSFFTDVFFQREPRLWEAFLRNDVLNASLTASQLKLIAKKVFKRLKNPDESHSKQELKKVLITMHQKQILFWALRKTLTKEEKVKFIRNFSKNGMVDIVALWILQENDPNMAQDLYVKIFHMPHPNLWRTFLQNEVLKSILYNSKLKWILNAVKEKLSQDIVDRDEWESILVLIAQNSNWCRELSYSYFIAMAEDSPVLRDYITSTESFCSHLEPFHIGVLATKFPNNLDKLIQTLLEALKDGKCEDKQFWAKASLKRLVIISEDARIKISCNLEYRFILFVLKEEFKIDRHFAKEVLKIPYLVKIWLGRNELFAYKHKLLTNNDFKELSDHFQYINMRVSQTYEIFYIETIKKAEENNSNKPLFRNLSLEYKSVCNKFEASDQIEASNNAVSVEEELIKPMHSLLISKSKIDKDNEDNDLREHFERESKVMLGRLGLSLFPRSK